MAYNTLNLLFDLPVS